MCTYSAVVVTALNNSSYRSRGNNATFHQNICKTGISKSFANSSKEGTDGVKRAKPDNQSLKLILVLPQHLKSLCVDRLIENDNDIMLSELVSNL